MAHQLTCRKMKKLPEKMNRPVVRCIAGLLSSDILILTVKI